MENAFIESLLDKGVLVFFFVVVLWVAYRYLNIRFDAMKRDLEKEIRHKRLRGTGRWKTEGNDAVSGNVEIDLVLNVSEEEGR